MAHIICYGRLRVTCLSFWDTLNLFLMAPPHEFTLEKGRELECALKKGPASLTPALSRVYLINRCPLYLNDGVGISDRAAIRSVQEGHILGPGVDGPDPAQLVLGLLGGDAVHGEPALDVVQQTEVLPGLVDLDHVHEAAGELGVGPRLAVDLDQALLHDGLDLLVGQGVLQTVPGGKKEDFNINR